MEARVVISSQMRSWCGSLALPLLLAACASNPQIKDEQLAKLPVEDRQALLDEDRAINVAEANLEASKAAVSEADRFKSIVIDEKKSAERMRDAAQKNASLQKERGDQQAAKMAQDRERLAAESMTALEAKGEYADRLHELRRQEREMREVELDRAKLQRERAEYEALKARGMAQDIDPTKFDKAERKIDERYREAQSRVSEAQTYADAARGRWNQSRQDYEADDARIRANEAPMTAPSEPQPIPQEGAKDQPAKNQPAKSQNK
jgi:hypothetical protein